MENCFRFLINVDQCLNMSNFDFFFYKLEHERKFHVSNVKMLDEASLHSAINNIRMYLDKYPYLVGDYQIIVTMRGKYSESPERWKDTMLYRLLRINYELRKFHIFINSVEQQEKALNLIMLYDSDFSIEIPELDHYMASKRLKRDFDLMLAQNGITDEVCRNGLPPEKRTKVDSAVRSILERFPGVLDDWERNPEDISAEYDSDSLKGFSPTEALFIFVKEQLNNIQVFEEHIDRNNRRQNILALLRVTEFINSSVERNVGITESSGIITLSQQCVNNWKKVWSDTALEKKYSKMLKRYQMRLSFVSDEFERPSLNALNIEELPKETIPDDNEIHADSPAFSDGDTNKSGFNLSSILDSFISSGISPRKVSSEWDGVYNRIKQALNNMDYELMRYAGELSQKYSCALEKRKRDTLPWNSSCYLANDSTANDMLNLEHEKSKRIDRLKSPHMTPSLSFQDQLNMENALERSNMAVRFYMRCMSKITAVNFLILFGVSLFLGILHYTVVQPYALQSMSTLTMYLIYVAAAAVLMLICWILPYQHFRSKLKKEIVLLQEDMQRYISGYFEKARYFCEYINLLNQLDFINRYHDLLSRANTTTQKFSQGYLWHKIQVQNHLSKLQFFQGLIDIAGPVNDKERYVNSLNLIDGDRICDITDCSFYWPQ